VSISLLLVSKSDFLVSISLLLVSKSDFLVADELASFSDDPAQLYVGSVDGARVFALNVLECPRCRSRMRILAAIEDPVVARKILDSLGLPSRAPPVAPARHNRQDELAQFWQSTDRLRRRALPRLMVSPGLKIDAFKSMCVPETSSSGWPQTSGFVRLVAASPPTPLRKTAFDSPTLRRVAVCCARGVKPLPSTMAKAMVCGVNRSTVPSRPPGPSTPPTIRTVPSGLIGKGPTFGLLYIWVGKGSLCV